MTYYITVIFLVMCSFSTYSSSFCKFGFSFFKRTKPYSSERKKEVKGMENYREILVRLTKSRLGVKDLSSGQIEALETYHNIVRGEIGEDGTLAGVGNYTLPQIRKIVQFLHGMFFPEQVSVLVESGVVEINRVELKVGDKKVLRNLDGGRVVFIMDSTSRDLRVSTVRTSMNIRKIIRILEWTDSGLLVEAEKIDPESGQLIKEELLIGKHRDYFLGNPEIENIFLAIQSTRKKISRHDLYLPLPTDNERLLMEQGHKASDVAGIDEVNEWVSLRRQLQELRANPYTTHIEYFVDQIPDHVAHIREGLVAYYSTSNNSDSMLHVQLNELGKLEREAKWTISNKGVTYKWWLEFNFRLANVMSGGGSHIKAISLLIKRHMAYISYFPVQIIVPTIEAIGIMTFNRANIEGVYPAGLINNRTVRVEGYEPTPFGFFTHDFDHAGFQGNQVHLEYSAGHLLFHKRLMNNMENLPLKRRGEIEALYFTVTHENLAQNISYPDREKVIKTVRDSTYNREIFGSYDHNRPERDNLVDLFMEVYNRALLRQ